MGISLTEDFSMSHLFWRGVPRLLISILYSIPSWKCWKKFYCRYNYNVCSFFGVITDVHSSSAWMFQNHLNINLKYIAFFLFFMYFLAVTTVIYFLKRVKATPLFKVGSDLFHWKLKSPAVDSLRFSSPLCDCYEIKGKFVCVIHHRFSIHYGSSKTFVRS